MTQHEVDMSCSFKGCLLEATWGILVGEEEFGACDEHRNDVLMGHDAKDVSGIFPLSTDDENGLRE